MDERGESALHALLRGLSGEDEYAAHHCDVILDAWGVEHECVPLLRGTDRVDEEVGADLYAPPPGLLPLPVTPAVGETAELISTLNDSTDRLDRVRAALTLIRRGEIDRAVVSLLLHVERDFGVWRETPDTFLFRHDTSNAGGDVFGHLKRSALRTDAEFHVLRWSLHYLGERALRSFRLAAQKSDHSLEDLLASSRHHFGIDPTRRPVFLLDDRDWMENEDLEPLESWLPLGVENDLDWAVRVAVDPNSGFDADDAAVFLLDQELSPEQQAGLVPMGRNLISHFRFPYRLFEKRNDIFLEKVADFRRMAMVRTGTPPHREMPGDFEAFETLLEITGELSGWAESYFLAVLDRGAADDRFGALEEVRTRRFDTPALRRAIEWCSENDPTDAVRETAVDLRVAFKNTNGRVAPEEDLDLPWVACRTRPAAHWLERLITSSGTDLHAMWCLFHLDAKSDEAIAALRLGLENGSDYLAHHCDVILDAWGAEHECVTLPDVREQTEQEREWARSVAEESEPGGAPFYYPPLGLFAPPIHPSDASIEACATTFLESEDPLARAAAAVELVQQRAKIDQVVAGVLLRFQSRFGSEADSPNDHRYYNDTIMFGGDLYGPNVRVSPVAEIDFHLLRWLLRTLGSRCVTGLRLAAETSPNTEEVLRKSVRHHFGIGLPEEPSGVGTRTHVVSISPVGAPLEDLQTWIPPRAYSILLELRELEAGQARYDELGTELAKILDWLPTEGGNAPGDCLMLGAAQVAVQSKVFIDLAIEHFLNPFGSDHSEEAAVFLSQVELSDAQRAALIPFGRPRHVQMGSGWPVTLYAQPNPVFLEKIADLRQITVLSRDMNADNGGRGNFDAFRAQLDITGKLTRWSESYLVATLERGPVSFRTRALQEIQERELDTPAIREAILECAESDPTAMVREHASEIAATWR